MNRDPLARAIAAICITIALLGSGLLLAHRTLGAVPQQALHPDEFLPLIVKPRASATATATMATATTTATTSPTTTATATATTTATASPTTTATATASPTTTATATATTMPTLVPTSDPLATSQLQLTNHTGFSLSFALEGPTTADGDVAPNITFLQSIRPGDYLLKVWTQCRYSELPFTVDAQHPNFGVTYNCP
jgi:hypothetical protein